MKSDQMTNKSVPPNSVIVSSPNILGGVPVIVGTRMPIARVLFLLSDSYTIDSIANEYPHIGKEKIEKAVNQLISEYGNPMNVTAL